MINIVGGNPPKCSHALAQYRTASISLRQIPRALVNPLRAEAL